MAASVWNAVWPNVSAGVLLVALFSVTIFVHELGHYLTARACGMVVDVFSIGFGPALWKKKIRGIVYKIGMVPLGGYVTLPQLDPSGMRVLQGTEGGGGGRRLPPVAPWRKVLVTVSGAMGNMLFAVVTAWVVYWVGVPAGPSERSTAVGYVATNSAAYARGLRIGDEILSVNDVAVRKWSDFRVETALSREATLRVRSPDGAHRRLTVPTEKGLFGELTVAGVEARDLCSVLSVERGMTAETAGLRPGDVISEFAGQEVFSKAHLIGLVGAHEGRTVPIRFKRQAGERAEVHTATVTPALDPITGQVRIGIQFSVMAVEHDLTVHPFPSEQLRGHVATTLRFLRALVTPREASAATKAVGGPVAIGASLWLISKASIMLAISFTGMLNVNLAILNLLPIPVLDGGHILFSLWELITRRPVNAKLANGLVNAFAAVLIALMVLLSLRDIARYTPAGRLVAGVLNGSTNRPAAPAAERGGASP